MIANEADLEALREQFEGPSFHEQRHCPICGAGGRVFGRPSVIDPDRPVQLDLLSCRRCGHGWIMPLPTQELLSHLYARASHSVIGVGWDSEVRQHFTMPERRVVRLEAESVPGAYFELGVGKGLLYRYFLERQWTCSGVEPGAWGRFPGVVSSLEELDPSMKFDVLVALDVLEHVSDPIGVLRRLRAAASHAARLYCAFPNIQSLRARLQRSNWRMARPLGHVHYFSRGSVRTMMRKAGFELTAMWRTDLVEPGAIHSVRDAVYQLIERLGLGDQWILSAAPARHREPLA